VYGVIKPSEADKSACLLLCKATCEPDSYEDCGDRIEMAWWLLTELADQMKGKKFVIERYPNKGMIVEMTPL
jgi:hypothetical protein